MKKILLIITCTLWVAAAFAQRTVTGKVTDENGIPVANASVAIKETGAGVNTDINGFFTIVLDARAKTLIFSYVEKASQEITIGSSSTINVTLRQQDALMNEVVVVSYGTVKKGDFTGSANQASYEDFKNRPIVNPLNALVATGPGVQTTAANGAPGSSPAIRVRGFGSIGNAAGPLIVVDGVAYDGGLANISSEDIETITTLKDAATVALWGSRASNGVVLITTKKGKKGRNNVSFKVLQGVSTRGLPEYDRVDPFQYYVLEWEALRNTLQYSSGQTAAVASQNATNQIKTQLGYNPFNVANNDIVRTDGTINPAAKLLWPDDLDWSDDLVRLGNRQEYVISYSGGSEKSDYFGSVGYVNEKGFILRSDWRRFSGRLNINTQPLSWFKTGMNVSAAINNSNQASDGSSTGFVNPFYFSRTIGPIYPVYAHNQTTGDYLVNSLGQRFYDLGNFSSLGIPNRPAGAYPGRHAIEETKLNQSFFKRNTISARTYGSLIFTPWLKFTTNVAVDITDRNASTYENTLVGDGAPAGRASKNVQKTITYTLNELLEFQKKFNQHNVSFLAGHENYDFTFNLVSGQKQGQALEGSIELPNFSVINSLTSREDNYNIESYFGRLNYDFDGKYFISGNFRRDGNSRFSQLVRWDNFWGAGVAWRVDKEKFMSHVSWLNMLKLRGSYGQVGNDGLLDANDNAIYYAYQALYDPLNNATEPGTVQSQLPNPNLTWESSNPFDAGIEFAVLKNRLRGTVEYYNREISNLIFNVSTPVSTGEFIVPTNVGNMYNRGFEIDLSGDIIAKKNFNLELKINASTIKNKITTMPEDNPEVINGTKKLAVGRSIFDYWLREWYGVDPNTGEALFRSDIWNPSTDRIIQNSKGLPDTVTTTSNNGRYHYAGTAIPKLFGGFETVVKYKDFELSVLFQYQIGGKVYDATYAELMHPGEYGAALHVDALKRWTKPGDITNVPRMQNSQDGFYNAASDRWLIDASFLNLRSITFSYQLPASLLSKMKAHDASFFLGAENVALISKRKGMNVNQAFSGVTSNVFTPARILTAGLSVNF